MPKRYIESEELERVPAGGGYEEWFDLRSFATLGAVKEIGRATNNLDRASMLLAAMIADWSLVDADGNKLPITPESIDQVKGELLEPLWGRVGALSESFLALASVIKSSM